MNAEQTFLLLAVGLFVFQVVVHCLMRWQSVWLSVIIAISVPLAVIWGASLHQIYSDARNGWEVLGALLATGVTVLSGLLTMVARYVLRHLFSRDRA